MNCLDQNLTVLHAVGWRLDVFFLSGVSNRDKSHVQGDRKRMADEVSEGATIRRIILSAKLDARAFDVTHAKLIQG